MLKAVHGYASHFYEALGQRLDSSERKTTKRVDERSMDETALLAFGILLEEAARASLGKDGDLVFTEGVGDDDAVGNDATQSHGPARHDSQTPVGFEGDEDFWRRTYPKRRKIREDQKSE